MKLLRSCSLRKLQNICRMDAGSRNNCDSFAGCRYKHRYIGGAFESAGRSARRKNAGSAQALDIVERLRQIRALVESTVECHWQGSSELDQFAGADDIDAALGRDIGPDLGRYERHTRDQVGARDESGARRQPAGRDRILHGWDVLA